MYNGNNLNQYAAITPESGTAFTPTFDADGNQTSIKTSTGIWTVTYNAENRPVLFVHAVSGIQMACKYDHMGRRFEKKVSYSNGEVLYCKRYAYEGYLQIAEFIVTESAGVETHTLETITFWDPSQPTATRPLAQTDFSGATQISYFYTHDLTKNVCELIDTNLNVITTYDYTPFGAASITGANVANRFMFSSEFFDQEPALVYYNFRHYNPTDGRWLSRDSIEEEGGYNLYGMIENNSIKNVDYMGKGSDINTFDHKRKSDNFYILYFYASGAFWAGEENDGDNSGYSHVAIGVLDKDPIGFYPNIGVSTLWRWSFGGEIKKDSKTAKVKYKCWCLTNKEIKQIEAYLKNNPIGDSKNLWTVNTNNCATFAYNAIKGLGRYPLKPNWDKGYSYTTAYRPEELRIAAASSDDCFEVK